jgi:hypothetical protein
LTGWSCSEGPPDSLVGFFVGALLSLPSALITKAYVPILLVGSGGGCLIGGLIHGWWPLG